MLFRKARLKAHKIAWSLIALWVVVCMVIATIGAGFLVLYNDRSELIKTNQALINQVKGTGETPVVDSPNDVVQGKSGEPGSPGPTGPRGPQGLPGVRGQVGPQGERGEPGSDGRTGVPGADSAVPGPAGAAGSDGSDGQDGAPGADSIVPGPAGAPGVAGAAGPAGPAGPPGADGKNGVDGKPGQDGRSVASVQCVVDGLSSYVVFYDQAGVELGRVQSTCVPAA
jgi:hypothetical protein